MEYRPQIRTIGNASVEEKEKSVSVLNQRLFSHFESLTQEDREELKKFEQEKPQIVVNLIAFANKETNRLMNEMGIVAYDIPLENYHVLSSEFYKKISGDGNASTFTSQQGILFNKDEFSDPVHFGAVAIHETLHLKAHLSLEVGEEGGAVSTSNYRRGVKVESLQKHSDSGLYHEHFKGLDEAIVAMQEKKSLGRLLDLPELSKEKEWLLSDKAQKLKKELSEKREIPEDDIIWVGEKVKNDWEMVSYPKQRQVLDYVCAEIQKQFPEQYQNVDEVFKEFLKSHFTGQLLVIARLVEKTFGEGSFRLLGNMGTDKSSGVLHLESLKKARMRQLRSK